MKDLKKENKTENEELDYMNGSIDLIERTLAELRARIKSLMAQKQILYNIRKKVK